MYSEHWAQERQLGGDSLVALFWHATSLVAATDKTSLDFQGLPDFQTDFYQNGWRMVILWPGYDSLKQVAGPWLEGNGLPQKASGLSNRSRSSPLSCLDRHHKGNIRQPGEEPEVLSLSSCQTRKDLRSIRAKDTATRRRFICVPLATSGGTGESWPQYG